MRKNSLSVIAISDTHLAEPDLPSGDILIHAGDWGSRGTLEEYSTFCNYLKKNSHKFKKIILVHGNHDFFGESSNSLCKLMIPSNAVILNHEYIEVLDLKIFGSPWVPQFYDWAFMKNDNNLDTLWENIPEGVDVLITHGPPYGILDNNPRGDFCGSITLKNHVIYRIKPRVHIFGHIHNGYGKLHLKNTTFYNVAIMDESYSPENSPTIIEL